MFKKEILSEYFRAHWIKTYIWIYKNIHTNIHAQFEWNWYEHLSGLKANLPLPI